MRGAPALVLSFVMLLAMPASGASQTPAPFPSPTEPACPSVGAAAAPGDSASRAPVSGRIAGAVGDTVGAARGAPDVILLVAVHADEVRFASQPRIQVRLCGNVGDTVHVLERRNLPKPVVAGTTYRDVYVAVEVLGHLGAQCLLGRLGVVAPAPAGADSTARAGAAADPCAAAGISVTGQGGAAAGAAGTPRPPE